jgi:hypothetical protein
MTAAWLVKLINDHAAAYGSMTDATAAQLLANSWLWAQPRRASEQVRAAPAGRPTAAQGRARLPGGEQASQ